MGTWPLPFCPVPRVGAEVMLSPSEHHSSWQLVPVVQPHRAQAAGQPLDAEILELVLVLQQCHCAVAGGGHVPGGEPSTVARQRSAVGTSVPLQGQGQSAMLSSGKLQPLLRDRSCCPACVHVLLSQAVTMAKSLATHGEGSALCGVGGLKPGRAKPDGAREDWGSTSPCTRSLAKEGPRGGRDAAPQGEFNPSCPRASMGGHQRCSEEAPRGEGQGSRAEPLLHLQEAG